jgi:hypothetical protein
MKKVLNNLAFILLGVLMTLPYLCRESKEYTPEADTIIEIDTTKYKNTYVPIPVAILTEPIKQNKGTKQALRDTFYIFDTIYIIKDYLSTRFYLDTLINDSNAFITVEDSVRQNRIVSRKSNVELFNKKITIREYPRGFYAGAGINTDFNIKLKLSYLHKKNIFSVGIGYGMDQKKTFEAEYHRRIGK